MPEDQVTVMVVATQCLLQDGENRICLPAGSGSLLWARRHREGEGASGSLPGRASEGDGKGARLHWGTVSLFPLQGQHPQVAASAISLLRGTAGPRLGVVPAPNRARAGVGVLGEPGCKGACGCASWWPHGTQGEAPVSPAGPDHSCPTGLCSLLPALPPHPAPRHETPEHPAGQRRCRQAL